MKADSRKGSLKRHMQALALVVMLWMCPVSVLWKQPAAAEQSGPTDGGTAPKVALTFDDGPSAQYTPVLLDGLKERGIRASFFVIGATIEKDGNEELIRRMKEEGHLIGNHTYSHIQLTSRNRESFREELVQTNEILEEITGEKISFVRPPYGSWDKSFEKELNMFPVLWNIDPLDWCSHNADCIASKVVEKAGDGDIILMHDYYETSVTAALEVVDILQKRGFQFVTVEEILFD